MNNRRKLLVALGASVIAAPLSSLAQQQPKVWRVGFLIPRSRPASAEADYFGAFPKRMRELGYIEGKNLEIEWRAADGRYERLPSLAAELVQLKMDVIVAATTLATSAMQKASTIVPIVMVNVANPVDSGFVESLARPGGNITGVSNMSGELRSKHLEILVSMVPKLSRVALLVNPTNLAHIATRKNIQAAAPRMGVKVLPLEAENLQEIEHAFSGIAKERVEAIIVTQDPAFNQYARQIAELAIKYRMASVFGTREPVVVGGLMSYGAINAEAFRRAASYVDKILKGAKPSELPVEQPTLFELVINGKTAKALGLRIPESILVQATEVIE